MKKIQLCLDQAHVDRLTNICDAYRLTARAAVEDLIDGAFLALSEQLRARYQELETTHTATSTEPTK